MSLRVSDLCSPAAETRTALRRPSSAVSNSGSFIVESQRAERRPPALGRLRTSRETNSRDPLTRQEPRHLWGLEPRGRHPGRASSGGSCTRPRGGCRGPRSSPSAWLGAVADSLLRPPSSPGPAEQLGPGRGLLGAEVSECGAQLESDEAPGKRGGPSCWSWVGVWGQSCPWSWRANETRVRAVGQDPRVLRCHQGTTHGGSPTLRDPRGTGWGFVGVEAASSSWLPTQGRALCQGCTVWSLSHGHPCVLGAPAPIGWHPCVPD